GVIREHMNPGAIFTYNTTSSNDVQKTAATVFPYAIRDDNFMIVSNRPILIDAAAWRRTLEAYRVEGHPVLDLHDPADRARLEELVSWVGRYGPGTEPAFAHALETRDSILARTSVSLSRCQAVLYDEKPARPPLRVQPLSTATPSASSTRSSRTRPVLPPQRDQPSVARLSDAERLGAAPSPRRRPLPIGLARPHLLGS